MKIVKAFIKDTSGAITIDWVVLTAAIVGLMFASFSVFTGGVTDHADLTAAELSSREIGAEYQ